MTEDRLIKGQELDALEELAKSFIIDYEPMSPRQKEIWENIQAMESELKRIKGKERRVNNIIILLWKAFKEISPKKEGSE